MIRNQYELIKPLIRPNIYDDEAPISYIIRLADSNKYKSFRWLFKSKTRSVSTLNHKISELLKANNWSGYRPGEGDAKKYRDISALHFISNKSRFCPQCLDENGYFKHVWQLKVSSCCKTHNVWLLDKCSSCGEEVRFSRSKLLECKCGADFRTMKSEEPSKKVLIMQSFLENEIDKIWSANQLLPKNHNLNLDNRIKLISMFSGWLSNRKLSRSGPSVSLSNMSSAKLCFNNIAEAVFGEETGFKNFLSNLQNEKVTSNSKDNQLKKFYRIFYNRFTDKVYDEFKVALENYLHKSWRQSLTRKNKLFKSSTIESHPWIPFEKACRDFGVNKSVLNRLIRNNEIHFHREYKTHRIFVNVYKPDLIERLDHIQDIITAKEAANILGLTKAQFSQLRKFIKLKTAIEPCVSCQTWIFSKVEITNYINNYLEKLKEESIERAKISFSSILKYYGGNIRNPLKTVIEAIDSNELKPIAKKKGYDGFKSLIFEKDDFLNWYSIIRKRDKYMSIPETAKLLGISQEFTYQLVNNSILTVSRRGNGRCIAESNLNKFKKEYVVLSKLAKECKIDSKTLIRYLSDNDISPVDQDWKKKMHQKVYRRRELKSVSILEGLI
ncbi:TniQ family protein [Pleionea sp. CnH1-48]|uniref:TniQ family protein n=1 Tax=Pleionea sp. CnH1-48 TaxID=2954494 RepID=UPI002096D9E1|nr:TniQ family protein [Pleionea sp. CnH1-48]MCO7226635.1 TniQ family protein [Pleionea sp. CnH1-48]